MEPMYRGIPFSPQTTLTATIGAADTVIPVADASVFPDPPNYATIGIDADGETISYAAKADNALSGCTRGVEGTPKSWASGSVIARNFTAKDLESLQENLRAVGRGVQSSWSQNDPDEANFIVGKTHWKEPGAVTSVLLDEVVKFSGKNVSVKLLPNLAYGIEVGETYFIVWDGVEYECVAKLDVFGQVIVGNQYIVDKINQTGEPFCLLSQDGDRFFARRSSREEKTISIKIQTRNGVVYHPLIPEYIPNGVPYVQTAAVGQTIVVSAVDVNGKPTKWKAVDVLGGGGSGLSIAEKALILSLFKNAVYTADMSATITQLEALWSGSDVPDVPVEPDNPDAPDGPAGGGSTEVTSEEDVVITGKTATDDGNGNVTVIGLTATDDGNGNVTVN